MRVKASGSGSRDIFFRTESADSNRREFITVFSEGLQKIFASALWQSEVAK
jgi:hypothetical protein